MREHVLLELVQELDDVGFSRQADELSDGVARPSSRVSTVRTRRETTLMHHEREMFWYAMLALPYSGTNIRCRSLTIHLCRDGQLPA